MVPQEVLLPAVNSLQTAPAAHSLFTDAQERTKYSKTETIQFPYIYHLKKELLLYYPI